MTGALPNGANVWIQTQTDTGKEIVYDPDNEQQVIYGQDK